MEGWQSRAAFVVHWRPETDIQAGRFEGRIEHIASYEAVRFHSLEELLAFVARMLGQLKDTDQP